jgi:hypothetical protein
MTKALMSSFARDGVMTNGGSWNQKRSKRVFLNALRGQRGKWQS